MMDAPHKPFEGDKGSKDDFTASTKYHISTAKPEWDVVFYEWDENGNIVPYGDKNVNRQSNLDILMKAFLRTDQKQYVIYSVELKERFGNWLSDRFGEENSIPDRYGNKGWVYEIKKDSSLMRGLDYGFIPLYANEYPDGVVRIWNIKKLKEKNVDFRRGKMHSNKYTDKPEAGTRDDERFFLMNKDGISFKRLKG